MKSTRENRDLGVGVDLVILHIARFFESILFTFGNENAKFGCNKLQNRTILRGPPRPPP